MDQEAHVRVMSLAEVQSGQRHPRRHGLMQVARRSHRSAGHPSRAPGGSTINQRWMRACLHGSGTSGRSTQCEADRTCSLA
jgi:hypothetical protein